MAKFHGVVGYAELVEVSKGVWSEEITQKDSSGDILRNTTRVQSSSGVNDNVTINNQISIIANPYATEHMFAMRYVEWMGVKWKITNVEVKPPRLILTIGGVYNVQP